jgi:DEAD/DEAH box helicase domain-containing protein
MGTLLKVVGAVWAIIGLGNLVGMNWEESSEGILSFGIMFNILLFVIPGLVVYGIGAGIKGRQVSSIEVDKRNPTPTPNKPSVEKRLNDENLYYRKDYAEKIEKRDSELKAKDDEIERLKSQIIILKKDIQNIRLREIQSHKDQLNQNKLESFDLFAEPEEKPVEKAALPKEAFRVLYLHLKTQKSADEVGGWAPVQIKLMKLAVGVVWDSRDQKYFVYRENEAEKLAEKLHSADLVVGFNVIGFDYTVLEGYGPFDLNKIKTFDMLLDVKKLLNHRLSLNHLAQHTLGAEKSADGLISIQWYKEGRIDKIIKSCQLDVAITRDLFLFGEKNGYVKYKTRAGKIEDLKVDWKTGDLVSFS